jgi:hypothetical protein
MKRREFIALLGGAVVWPFTINAQQSLPVVGFLSSRSPEESAHLTEAFRGGLKDGGFIEGQSVSLEFRWALGNYGRLPALAAELVNRRVSVIAAVGGDPSNKAAKQATATIPIVFATGSDPVETGLVESFNRPGGNATGVTIDDRGSASGGGQWHPNEVANYIWAVTPASDAIFLTKYAGLTFTANIGLGTNSSVISRARVFPEAGSADKNANLGVVSH